MSESIDLKFLSEDVTPLSSLLETKDMFVHYKGGKEFSLEIDQNEPTHVKAGIAGWYEVMVAIGLIQLPAAVLANVLATWISSALSRHFNTAHDDPSEIKLVFRRGDRTSEVHITTSDIALLKRLISEALNHVN